MELEAANHFRFEGTCISSSGLNSGLVNRSYLIITDAGRKYTLQCISSYAFHDIPGLLENAIAVSTHIASKGGHTLKFIPSFEGTYFYKDINGHYWRSYEYIDDCICLSVPEFPEDLYESSIAFGTFQSMLRDFPASTLCETIPHFHDTPDRYSKLHSSIRRDSMKRVSSASDEISFALKREGISGILMELLNKGELPLRVTHNDTKLSNVLLDAKTRKAVCVIDLDTVMPGLSAFDFGDAIRSGASTTSEDETSLNLVSIDLGLYRLYAKGFLTACPQLTENEKRVLPLGAKIITLECGVRFLTDYLNGDKYFRTDYPDHNLDRARNQFALFSDMEDKWEEMNSVILPFI